MAKLAQPHAPRRGCADARSLSAACTAYDSMRSHDMHQVQITHLESTVMTHPTQLATRPHVGLTIARCSELRDGREGEELEADHEDEEADNEDKEAGTDTCRAPPCRCTNTCPALPCEALEEDHEDKDDAKSLKRTRRTK